MKNSIKITTDRSRIDLDYVHNYLSKKSYWAKGISQHLVEKSVENSLCFSVFSNEKQIGFGRVVTDYATFAYLCDVFIDEDFQGKGFSKKLMESIMAHPDLQSIRRWMLMTWSAQGLYKQFGFSIAARPDRVMEISSPNMYQNT